MFIHLDNHVVILSRWSTLTWVKEVEINWLERVTKVLEINFHFITNYEASKYLLRKSLQNFNIMHFLCMHQHTQTYLFLHQLTKHNLKTKVTHFHFSLCRVLAGHRIHSFEAPNTEHSGYANCILDSAWLRVTTVQRDSSEPVAQQPIRSLFFVDPEVSLPYS